MGYLTRENNDLIFRNNGETIVVSPWGRDSVRVRAALMSDVRDDRFALLDPVVCEDELEITVEEKKGTMRHGRLTVVVEVDGWLRNGRISLHNDKGELLLRETESGNALKLTPREFQPLTGGDFALNVSFDGQDDEHIYGMGQYQEEQVDWKGCTLELKHRNSQASVPMLISSRGYGFLWHNPALGYASFGKNRTTWHADASRQVDYWVTAGEKPADISRNYAQATGFAPMMPEYGLGFWQCKLRYWNQEQVLNVAREYKRRGLKIDVIVIDFFHWPKLGDYKFDPEFFPDPEAMISELKSMGIELMVSVWPLVAMSSENYEEMNRQGLLMRADYGEQVALRFVEDAMFFDATNPRARDYVWKVYKKNYYDKGVRVFWLDEAEPELGSYDFRHFRYHEGNGQLVGNIYPQCYSRLFYEGMTSEGQENPVNLVRCAWAGSQRYGALVWSGDIMCDWTYFRRQVCAGLSMGAAGIPWWTTDIGGFHAGNPKDEGFRELLIRWFQWGCYCPVMRLHGDRQPSEPVYRKDGTRVPNSGSDNEVWSFGDEAYPILVKYMKRREDMRPYVRGLMKTAHEEGTPLLRGMYYEFPDDGECAGLQDQYMFGPDLLVAPVMAPGARKRSVYFPQGASWRSVETGEVISGGQRVEVPAPLDVIPVYERV